MKSAERKNANSFILMTLSVVVSICVGRLLPQRSSATPVDLAYIDPGSGLLVWQLLVASAVGVVFHVRRWLVSVFRRITVGRSKEIK